MRKLKKLARATQATEYDVFYNFENLSLQVRHLLRCKNSLVSQSNEWNYGGFTCVLFLHEHVRSDNSSYPEIETARIHLDRACFLWCFFRNWHSTLLWLEAPKHLVPTHPFVSQYTFTIPRPSIQLQLDSFRRKNVVNTENSTTLTDMKNVEKYWKLTTNLC